MKRTHVFILLSLLVVLAGCGGRHPEPTIIVQGETISTVEGSSSWMTFNRGTIKDAAAAPILVRGMEPKTFPPASELKIQYSKKPKQVTLSQWIESEEGAAQIQSIVLESDTIQLPNEAGDYIYSVRADWKNGGAEHAFIVRIE